MTQFSKQHFMIYRIESLGKIKEYTYNIISIF